MYTCALLLISDRACPMGQSWHSCALKRFMIVKHNQCSHIYRSEQGCSFRVLYTLLAPRKYSLSPQSALGPLLCQCLMSVMCMLCRCRLTFLTKTCITDAWHIVIGMITDSVSRKRL